jgi:hypothetical protein
VERSHHCCLQAFHPHHFHFFHKLDFGLPWMPAVESTKILGPGLMFLLLVLLKVVLIDSHLVKSPMKTTKHTFTKNISIQLRYVKMSKEKTSSQNRCDPEILGLLSEEL